MSQIKGIRSSEFSVPRFTDSKTGSSSRGNYGNIETVSTSSNSLSSSSSVDSETLDLTSVLSVGEISNIDFGLSTDVANQRLNYIYSYLKKYGMDDVHNAAILGNIRFESGAQINPAANTERLLHDDYEHNVYLDQRTGEEIITFDWSRRDDSEYKEQARKDLLESKAVPIYGGIGLVQWTGGLWDDATKSWVTGKNGSKKADFLNWCNARDKDWYEIDTQLEYITYEYNDWDLKNDFENIGNVSDAARFYCNNFERPGDDTVDDRISLANGFYQAIIDYNK